MFRNRIFFSSVLSLSIIIAKADSRQSIEIVNNSDQPMNINSNNADHSLYLNQTVPAFARSFIIIEIRKLQSLQDRLFEAILNNSAEEVLQAIQAGANVNMEKDGKSPLFWAVSFHRNTAAMCLLEHGAV